MLNIIVFLAVAALIAMPMVMDGLAEWRWRRFERAMRRLEK